MAKKNKGSTKASSSSKGTMTMWTRYSRPQMDTALLEYVRNNYSASASQRITGVEFHAISRAWEALSEEERQDYRERAQNIADSVQEAITEKEISVITEITQKAKTISDLALEEIEERLRNPLKKIEIKDSDLIAIASKCISIVTENTRLQEAEDTQASQKTTNIFNILDQSIQENLTISSMKYEDE